MLCVYFRRILVNYTVGTELDPDVFAASTNCQNSMVMHENYLLDRVLQDEFTEIARVRVEMASYQQKIEFADVMRDSTRFFQPPSLPPPPPPSPPPPGAPSQVVATAPPNPPTSFSYEVYVQQLNQELSVLQGRERALLNEIEGCESFGGSRTRVCGLSAVEGPNPWIAKNGQPCRGNTTLSARFGDFCSYWDSEVRANDEQHELSDRSDLTPTYSARSPDFANAFVFVFAVQCRRRPHRRKVGAAKGGDLVLCGRSWHQGARVRRIRAAHAARRRARTRGALLSHSHSPGAKLTPCSRSLSCFRQHWMRPDRHYCESSFFRSRIVPDSEALHSAETCRLVVATRNETCYKGCDVCDAFCSSGLARAVKDTIKCTFDLPTLGITAAAHVSDAGQQIAYGHGAIRTKGRPYTPETGYLEQFDILVNNDIDHPRVNRDSVSCRRPHRESRTGAFVPGLNNNGKPKKRTGFMVCAAL